MPELVWVHDVVDRPHETVGDVQREHRDRTTAAIDDDGPRLTAHPSRNDPRAGRLSLAERRKEESSHAEAAADGLTHGRHLTPAIGMELHVLSEHLLQSGQISLLAGGEEAASERLAASWGDLEARNLLPQVASGPGKDLPAVGHAFVHNLSDVAVVVVEDLAKEKDRSFYGGEPLQHGQERDRNRVCMLMADSGVLVDRDIYEWFGEPRTDVDFPPPRAERR